MAVAAQDVPDDELTGHWHDIEVATARVHRQLDEDLEAAGVPPQWYPVLDLLLSSPNHRLPMSTLARELSMTSGGFSKLADRIAADGLIDRRGTTDDRRVVHATLTDAGLAMARAAREVFVRALRRRLDQLDGESLAAVARTLQALAADAPENDEGTGAEPVPDHVVHERDPALPDRRGRGRVSGIDSF